MKSLQQWNALSNVRQTSATRSADLEYLNDNGRYGGNPCEMVQAVPSRGTVVSVGDRSSRFETGSRDDSNLEVDVREMKGLEGRVHL